MSTISFVFVHDTYFVNGHNQFRRGLLIPSNDWKLTGAVEYKFGRVIRRYTVDDIRGKAVPWFYKNGKQRCFVAQYDHGSYSVMMGPRLVDVRIL